MANENPELCSKYGITQAPTLVIADGEEFVKYVGAGAIKQFLAQNAERKNA